MPPLIHLEKVSKKFHLRRDRPRSFREIFMRWWKRGEQPPDDREVLWAVREASFDVSPGETVGLIGPNGAGKSTTFKLISRIIQPTSGRVSVNGRVAALLELGTGFHPELSGRDNIFLSAALIGMSRREMQRKFDAIVDFSELEAFIDTPVKHYSSGMFARLAFAVSIHLEPEALLVDEVLSVGDQAFQQKCSDRLAALQHDGVTICMVSHSMDAVRAMCTRAIWFDHGRIRADGSAESVVRQYLDATNAVEARRLAEPQAPPPVESPQRWGTRQIEIVGVRLLDANGAERTIFETGDTLVIEMDYVAHSSIPAPIFGIAVHRQDGIHITGPNTGFAGLTLPTVLGRGCVRYTVPHLPLLDGLYHLTTTTINQTDTEMFDYHDRMYPFRVLNSATALQERYGLMTLQGEWQHRGPAESGRD